MNRKERRAARKQATPARPAQAADELFRLAMQHHQAGRLDQAEGCYRDLLAVAPEHPGGLQYFGILSHQRGNSALALKLMDRALARNEQNPDCHYNIGLVYAALGRMDEAAAHNRRALALRPGYADAHTNLANALLSQNKAGEAIEHFRWALRQQPQSIGAHVNLAGAMLVQQDVEGALAIVERGLAIAETPPLKALFVRAVTRLRAAPETGEFRALLLHALTENWCAPRVLAPIAAALLTREEAIGAAIERSSQSWPHRTGAHDLFGPTAIAALADNRLLMELLMCTVLPDVAWERLLTNLRLAILDLATAPRADDGPDHVLDFAGALARQCFINDYVFCTTDEEEARVRALYDAVDAALTSGAPLAGIAVAALACYLPLHTLTQADVLPERSWPDAVAAILAQQVEEPREERRLRSAIPVLTPIEDAVSLSVRQQYEENPYPRWVRTAFEEPVTIDAHIHRVFPRAPYRDMEAREVEILVAGCGTGHHPITVARQFAGARVLAVDLSLTSLCYAQRKTRTLGLSNIEYGQADILRLGALGRDFDVIEAVGVLHHLENPFAGWRMLLSLLRPGGLMHVGLYSRLGREDVRAARTFIAEGGYAPSPEGIRRCRQDILMAVAGAPLRDVAKRADFFNTSACRDLIFHGQEHQSTLPEIGDFLAANHLVFLGFEALGGVDEGYRERFPGDAAMTNLGNWHRLETEDPGIFGSMYQFWVQKPRSGKGGRGAS